ncbi:MAG: hypothetical protein JF589_16980, partial [Gemmatimonadetes bacterium]|nr:hypothetical protein [Gemmatimonadota bacterium]
GSEPQDGRPDIVMIGGEAYAWAETHEGIFEGGLCPECRHAIGPRTAKRLQLRSLQSGPRNGGSITVLGSPFAGPTMRFVSAGFRALLTPDEDAQFEWREIEPPPRSRKVYFELVGAKHVVPYMKASAAPQSGWWCERCGYATSPFRSESGWNGPSWHVAQSELPPMPPDVFAAGEAPDLDFCCTRARWRELMKLPGARGCRSYDIGVLIDNEIDRAPARASWREIEARRLARETERIAKEPPVTYKEPPATSTLRIVLGGYDTGWQSPQKSLAAAGRIVRAANAVCANLIVFPEMCTTGFAMDPTTAEPTDGTGIKQLGVLAHKSGIHLLAGVALREQAQGRERVVNAAIHLDVHGNIATTYRKRRMSAHTGENDVYAPGSDALIDDVYGVRIAYFIGDELRVPELFRAVACDVDAMIIMANWPSERIAHWEILLRARAIENQCYVIGVNRTGQGGGTEYGEHSMAFDPWGEPVHVSQDGVLRVDVAQVRVREVRETYPFLGDMT